jgi:hypothetical protein
MTIGHPDFLASVNPATPVEIASGGPFAANVGWSIPNAQVPSGGAYMIVVRNETFTGAMAVTDIQVTHLDSSGQIVYEEYFGGVWVGGAALGRNACQSAIVRGNTYGSTLQITGVTSSLAFITGLLPGLSIASSRINVAVYSIPFTITDPSPKVYSSATFGGALSVQTPNQLVGEYVGVNVGPASSSPNVPLLSYAGPAVLMGTITALTNNANGIILVNSYTVSGGSAAPVAFKNFRGWANAQYAAVPINLPAAFNVMRIQNQEAANTINVNLDITGNAAA